MENPKESSQNNPAETPPIVAGFSQDTTGSQARKPWYAKLFSLRFFFGVVSVVSLLTSIGLYVKEEIDFRKVRRMSDTNLTEYWRENGHIATEIRKWTEERITTSENSSRQYIDAVKTLNAMEIRKLQAELSGGNFRPSLNTSLLQIKSDIEILISTVGSLRENLTRLNRSADSKTRGLRDNLKETRGKLAQIQNELEHMNASHQLKLQKNSAALISTVKNVKKSLLKLNNASNSRMRSLMSTTENIKNNLILITNKLTHLNNSLNTESTHVRVSVASSIQDLRNDLTNVTNLMASKISQIWIALNQTDESVVKISALLSHHNVSFHTKLRQASQALSTEVKNLGKKLVDIQNNTAKKFNQLRSDVDNTRDSLWKAHDKIAQSNRSLHSALDKLSTNLQNSLKNVNQKITILRNDFETNKNDVVEQHKAIDYKISRMKDEFRESERKLKDSASGLKTRMKKTEEDLKHEQDSQASKLSKLQKELNQLRAMVLKNKASSMPKPNIFVIVLCTCIWSFQQFRLA